MILLGLQDRKILGLYQDTAHRLGAPPQGDGIMELYCILDPATVFYTTLGDYTFKRLVEVFSCYLLTIFNPTHLFLRFASLCVYYT